MRIVFRILVWLIGAVVLMSLAVTAFVYLAPIFGAAGERGDDPRIAASAQFDGEQFRNADQTEVMTEGQVDPDRSTLDFFFPPEGKRPVAPIPSVRFHASELSNGHAAWLGHSTFLFRIGDRAVLVDPVFFDPSPVPYAVHTFDLEQPPAIDDIPSVDAVLISHDHYDHLDYRAVVALDKKVGQFLVPLGVGAHFARWGIDARKVVEFDWYEDYDMGDVRFTFTPARHFSGRALTNRNTTLWGGWAIRSPEHNIFYSGDTGYFDGLAEIGQRLGPFDIAFIENGAYDPTWADIHMTPEQSVQASVDLDAAAFFPVHWAKYDLAFHNWDDPILRAVAAASENEVALVAPLIGEVFELGQWPQRDWWRALRSESER